MNKKSLLRLIVVAAAAFFLIKLCTSSLGSVITLPGGTGGSTSSTEDSGGWFSPKNNKESSTTDTQNKTVEEIAKEIERELGIGKESGSKSTTSSSTETSVSATSPLTFKGIPIQGTLAEFGSKLVKAGFKNSGNGVYTGNFAGYNSCKVTSIGNNPVYEVRVDFPVISNWDSLEKAYDSLQASLTEKYGVEPTLLSGTNIATYDVPGGTITLDADVKEQSSWHVILKYTNQLVTSSPGSLQKNPIDDL